MAAENNLNNVAANAKVLDIEFTSRFTEDASGLLNLLSVTKPITMALGTQIKIYKTSGTLEAAQTTEGELIGLSKYQCELAATHELTFNKWRKATTMEAIAKRGYGQAVEESDKKMLHDIQAGIRKQIITFLGTGTGTAKGKGFQAALANGWGQLNTAFQDQAITAVYFVNPLDIADYLGSASVSLQTAFGMSYIMNFLGLGTVVVDSNIPKGTAYATAKENLNVYSANPANIPGFEFYTDESGLVGVNHATEYKNATYETVAVSAMKIFPEFLDRIIKITIEPVSAKG